MAKLTTTLKTGFKVLVLNIVTWIITWLLTLILAVIGVGFGMGMLSDRTPKGIFALILSAVFIFGILFLNGLLARLMWRWN